MRRLSLLILMFSSLLAFHSRAADAPDKNAAKADKPAVKQEVKSDKKELKEETVITTNRVTVGGRELKYAATAGTIVLKEEEGKPRASFFYVAYRLLESNTGTRPVTFSFNGGPGSSSVWLHLGILGPRRAKLTDEGFLPPPPYQVINNEFSLLDKSDLVFIDPVSTGFSRAAAADEAKNFHGLEEDAESVAEFIRLYVSRNNRWSSPKFLIGESYGTTRAAKLSGLLQERFGMYLNGIMLVSVVLDFQTISFVPGNDLPYVLFLPTYTSTAWYHKKLKGNLQASLLDAMNESEKFATGEYLLALNKGAALPDAERKHIVQKLSELTGLSEDFVDRADLRIHAGNFFKELLRGERKTVGRFDSRLTARDRDSVGDVPETDPSYHSVLGPYTAAFNDYVRRELKYESDLPYEMLTGKVQPWNYGDYKNKFVNVAETLRQGMNINPHLKVFVANGIYDLATPYFGTKYTFEHLGLPDDLRKNIELQFYPAGHMMYTQEESLKKLRNDLARFIDGTLQK
ncbi:MAG: peptidase serine carboxypeptidase [Verrucomicrobiales bacterium]|nr:peptidase serine carboxypeptidase [Verrucomicrobiales bacterium]